MVFRKKSFVNSLDFSILKCFTCGGRKVELSKKGDGVQLPSCDGFCIVHIKLTESYIKRVYNVWRGRLRATVSMRGRLGPDRLGANQKINN